MQRYVVIVNAHALDVVFLTQYIFLTALCFNVSRNCGCVFWQDLLRIKKIFDVSEITETQYESSDVVEYYEHTCQIDYKILQFFSGQGLHSALTLPTPVSRTGSTCIQPAWVLKEIGHLSAKNVLEIGCGQGFCTFFLANLCPETRFQGIDITPIHIEIANQSVTSQPFKNTFFSLCDATRFDNVPLLQYDIIFSVEALCHLDTAQKRHMFLSQAARNLSSHGRIVIIDGFRSADFDGAPENQKIAMRLAEAGFRIQQMASKKNWIELAQDLNFRLVQDTDFTANVLPFWVRGWKLVHFMLNFSWMLQFVNVMHPARKHSAANFLAVAMTAHAFRNRAAAEYGMLVFEKKTQ